MNCPWTAPDVARRREGIEQGEEPVTAAIASEALDLGKVQRQIVSEDPVLDLGLGLGDGLMGLRQLLHIVDPGDEGS